MTKSGLLAAGSILSRAYKGGFSWSVNTEFTQNWEEDASVGSINFTVA